MLLPRRGHGCPCSCAQKERCDAALSQASGGHVRRCPQGGWRRGSVGGPPGGGTSVAGLRRTGTAARGARGARAAVAPGAVDGIGGCVRLMSRHRQQLRALPLCQGGPVHLRMFWSVHPPWCCLRGLVYIAVKDDYTMAYVPLPCITHTEHQDSNLSRHSRRPPQVYDAAPIRFMKSLLISQHASSCNCQPHKSVLGVCS